MDVNYDICITALLTFVALRKGRVDVNGSVSNSSGRLVTVALRKGRVDVNQIQKEDALFKLQVASRKGRVDVNNLTGASPTDVAIRVS